MALGRSNSRAGERPKISSSTYIITGTVFVGFSLIAVWVLTAPAPIPEEPVRGGRGAVTSAIDRQETAVNHRPAKSDPDASGASNDSSGAGADADAIGGTTLSVGDEEIADRISADAELTKENKEANKTYLETQAAESKEEKNLTSTDPGHETTEDSPAATSQTGSAVRTWKVCKFEGAQDFIPCLDNETAIKKLKSRNHYEHRERHCPSEDELPKCLLPLAANYKAPIKWPKSRDQVNPNFHTSSEG